MSGRHAHQGLLLPSPLGAEGIRRWVLVPKPLEVMPVREQRDRYRPCRSRPLDGLNVRIWNGRLHLHSSRTDPPTLVDSRSFRIPSGWTAGAAADDNERIEESRELRIREAP